MTNILIEKNVMVPMRDGVRLATDVYRLHGYEPARCWCARGARSRVHTGNQPRPPRRSACVSVDSSGDRAMTAVVTARDDRR
jgi:predicted acyl esterase